MGARHFTTYMKARIYCEREVPSGREFVGALEYQYNDMSEYFSDLVFPSSILVTINNTVCGLINFEYRKRVSHKLMVVVCR